MIKPSDAETAQRMVSLLTLEQIQNVFENLASPGTIDDLGPDYVEFVRGLLFRRLDSLRRGRRGLMSIAQIPGL